VGSDRESGGAGVLSKYRIKEIEWIPAHSKWFHGWVLRVKHAKRVFNIINTHLRPPLGKTSSVPNPVEWKKALKHRVADLQDWMSYLDKDVPAIIAGDFNESRTGVYSGKCIGFLENQGYIDAVHQYQAKVNTWVWKLPVGTLKGKFDHIFYEPTKMACKSATVIKAGQSDHFPVLSELVINAGA